MNILTLTLATAAAGLAVASSLHTAAKANARKGEAAVMAAGTAAPADVAARHAVEERNKALVRDRFAAWADGTGSPFELLAEDATWTITGRSAYSFHISIYETDINSYSTISEISGIRPCNHILPIICCC